MAMGFDMHELKQYRPNTARRQTRDLEPTYALREMLCGMKRLSAEMQAMQSALKNLIPDGYRK